MDQSIIKPKVNRRSSGDIKLLLEEFTKAGISVKAFCIQHSIGKSTFHKWQSSYKSKQQEGQPASKAFADIHIISPGEDAAALFAAVNGIKIYQPVTAAYLKELL